MPTTIKQLLLDQFKATYNEENWFKPLKDVLEDLTDEEFKWKEGEELHSIRQLVIHLIFWNERYMNRLRNTPLKPVKMEGRDISFDDNGLSKKELIKNLYDMMDEFEKLIENAPEEKFDERIFVETDLPDLWWQSLQCVNTHTAYHLGQIMSVKKKLKAKK